MSIENNLERIANALEKIALAVSHPAGAAVEQKVADISSKSKAKETKTEESKVEETKVEETKTEESRVEETKVEETKIGGTKPPTWKELREHFIGTLNLIREKTGSHDDARSTGLALLKQYAAGNGMKEENVPPEFYIAFFASLNELRAKYNG